MLRRFAVLCLLIVSAMVAANPEGEALIVKIAALKPPAWDAGKGEDKAYKDDYMAKYKVYNDQRNALIWSLFIADPKNPKTPGLMEERWEQFETGVIQGGAAYAKRVIADIDKVIAMKPEAAILEVAKYSRVSARLNDIDLTSDEAIRLCDGFAQEFPKSPRGETLYLSCAAMIESGDHLPIYRAFLKHYPNGKYSPMIRGAIRQGEAVGKPFELKFNDAITGKPFDISALKGKVVVIDFWATWCGPFVAKMPELKRIYETYSSKGLAVVGVSLDEAESGGGLTKLKEFVAKNGIPWPQYYQGSGWESAFSTAWGIMSIPNVFIVDKRGKLREVQARDVEATVKSLLAEK